MLMEVRLFCELTGKVFPVSLSVLHLFQTQSVALIQAIPRGVLSIPYRNIHHATVRSSFSGRCYRACEIKQFSEDVFQ